MAKTLRMLTKREVAELANLYRRIPNLRHRVSVEDNALIRAVQAKFCIANKLGAPSAGVASPDAADGEKRNA